MGSYQASEACTFPMRPPPHAAQTPHKQAEAPNRHIFPVPHGKGLGELHSSPVALFLS